jgi:hypothetical protein
MKISAWLPHGGGVCVCVCVGGTRIEALLFILQKQAEW